MDQAPDGHSIRTLPTTLRPELLEKGMGMATGPEGSSSITVVWGCVQYSRQEHSPTAALDVHGLNVAGARPQRICGALVR
jgi:hypothetical protein